MRRFAELLPIFLSGWKLGAASNTFFTVSTLKFYFGRSPLLLGKPTWTVRTTPWSKAEVKEKKSPFLGLDKDNLRPPNPTPKKISERQITHIWHYTI